MDFSNLPKPPPKMRIYILGPALEKDALQVAPLHHGAERLYGVWRAKRASTQRPFYVCTKGSRILDRGDQELFLRPLDNLDFLRGDGQPGYFESGALQKMAKEQGIDLKREADSETSAGTDEMIPRTPEELVDELEKRHLEAEKSLFYRTASPFELGVLLDLKEDLPSALDQAIQGGWRVDEDLAFLFRAHIPVVDPAIVPPEIAQRYGPHLILVTGTKAGKSSMARRIGRVVERPTPAGLLGFATADSRRYGIVHGSYRTVFVDEVAQAPKEEAATNLPTYLELGDVEIARGITIRITGHGPVVFMSNPPEHEEVFDPFQRFLTVVRALSTTNTLGLGSRIAAFLYKPETAPAYDEGKLKDEDRRKAEALLLSFQVHSARVFSKTLLDDRVQEWLDGGFPETHLNRLRPENVHFPEMAAFLWGYRDGQRHARALALRIAFVDTCHLHLEAREPQIQALLVRADDVFPRVVALREESLRRVLSLAADPGIRRQSLRSLFRSLRREFISRALGAIAYWSRDRDEILEGRPYPFEDARTPYLRSSIHDRKDRYTFPYLASVLERNLNEASASLESFGVRLSTGSYGVEFTVTNLQLFQEAMKIIRSLHGGNVGKVGEVGNEADEAKSPQNPADAPSTDVRTPLGKRRRTSAANHEGGERDASVAHPADASLVEDAVRYVKLMDRGYGVPSTAIAYGLELERKSINGALVEALNRGLLVEPRPGVYRLPKKG